jgi:hypothetical protein
VSINEERARACDPIGMQVFRAQGDLPVALPENGALAGLLVNEDEGRLAHAAGGHDPVCIDTLPGHFRLLKLPGFVVAYFADIPGAQSPALASGNRACGLTSCATLGGEDFDLRIEGREMGKADDGVSGVDADTDDIDRRLVEVLHKMIIFTRAGKCEKIRREESKERMGTNT